jgi:hypothetical protein
MAANAAQSAVLRRLAEAGGWVGRTQLATGLQWTEQRVDDELCELLLAGAALYNPRGREYRLGGSPLARKALQRLLASDHKHVLLATPHKTEPVMQVGLATRAVDYTGGELLVMCDVDMPYEAQNPEHIQRLCEAIANFDRGLQRLATPRQAA